MDIDHRTTVLFAGVAVAVAAGLGAGHWMRPELALPAAHMEPPGVATEARAVLPAGVWTGPGPVPDYVIGTDWLPRPLAALTELKPDEPLPALAEAPPPALPYGDVSHGEPDPSPPSSYPSQSGDILAGLSASIDGPGEGPPAI